MLIVLSSLGLVLAGCSQASTSTTTADPSTPAQAEAEQSPQLDVSDMLTPTEVVDAMLKVAKVSKESSSGSETVTFENR